MKTFCSKSAGFSLVEIAIVLVIVGLLLGGLLMPLATQQEQRKVGDTQKTLDEVRDALIGFAVANGRLPRPATSPTVGAENPVACVTEVACTGLIPWTTLGLTKWTDGWDKIIRYSVTPAYAGGATGTAPFTLATAATKTIMTRNAASALIVQVTPVPVVIFSSGNRNWGILLNGNAVPDNSGTNADEDANQAASVAFISRPPREATAAAGGEFDDIVTWLPLNTLYNRMVAAGRLP